MDAIQRMHYENDRAEAFAIELQRSIAPPGVTIQHIIDLNRFCDCAEDGEGYDVPKDRMRALRDVGLVSGGRFGYYQTTDEGERVRAAWFGVADNA